MEGVKGVVAINTLSPFRLSNADFRAFFLRICRVIFLIFVVALYVLGKLPELFGAQTEIVVTIRFIPEHLVLQFIRFCVVYNTKALVILRALVHDLTKALKRGKHTGVILVNTLAIGNIWLAQNKNEVNIGAERGGYS